MTAFSGSSALTSGPNYSYYSIPAAWILAMIPHFVAAGLAGDKFKNTTPRQMLADLLAKKDKTALDKKIIRAESANYNGFYIYVTSETVSALRSGAYLSGIGIIFTLFIKAGLRLN
ncbi:hypothetical protein PHSY_003056 [Pseudozyma hubeiensis SY62]|uniref:Uncharacterized protein n=1 Tax=Pseudozyma hubeiensis (strain SY62) TaxID=1305764 RepID=R9PBN0_PSEHS|nr:hypothetical protein PHSY_003056 [Pseudozyma hubeiensis SY62]GAC95480.1 hypothetical protein PHSY_003056 [Pseudozyma hubeiensis SY62]